jgi:hypothetical protein
VTVDVEDFQEFKGGRSWMARAGVLGLIGMVATAVGLASDTQEAYFAYLVAFTYWAGVGIGSLLLLMIFHTFHAKWMTVLRRPIEVMAAATPILFLLFIPVAIGLVKGKLYPWVDIDAYVKAAGLNHEQEHIMHAKHSYLGVVFFLIRTAVYLAVVSFLSLRLWSLSTRQDKTGDVQLTVAMRRLSAGGLPFLALVIAFAAMDWIMTLTPLWFSTMFGVYYFAGSFLTTLSMVALINALARGKDLYGDLVTAEHSHNIGKLMFAFTCFWTYIGFSQFMLIWIANLPEETPFFTLRMEEPWKIVSILLLIFHFFIPFLILLSKNLKRNPRRLAVMAVWLMAVNFLDLYWLIIPTLSPKAVAFPWVLPFAWVGVGGIGITFAVWRQRNHFTVPIKDPFLATSLRYRQP